MTKLKDDKYLIIGDEFHDDKDFRKLKNCPSILTGRDTHMNPDLSYTATTEKTAN